MGKACDVETLDDFRRYYQNAYIGIEEKDCVMPAYYAGTDGSAMLFHKMVKEENDKFYLGNDTYSISFKDMNSRKDIIFGTPELGMFRNKDTIAFAAKRAVRGSSRGLRQNLLSFHGFNDWDIRETSIGIVSANNLARHDVVWNIYNPQYEGAHSAINKLNEGVRVGIPISRQFGLYTVATSPNINLAYKRWRVGYLRTWEIVLDPKFEMHVQQVREAFPNWEIRYG